ncbi:hypothetical protein HY991_05800 [Candidatus Micrarchaeota archaeon]|nr:hypothetical protein [Candidatus Micrarchaeota archaeon]
MEEFILLHYRNGLEFLGEARSPTKEQAIELLNKLNSLSREKIFEYAPIDKKCVEAAAKKDSERIKSIADFIEATKEIQPAKLESQLKACMKTSEEDAATTLEKKRGDPVVFALSYYLHLLLERILPQDRVSLSKSKSGSKEIRFAANYGGWQVVKKVDLEKAKQKAALACLAGIYSCAERKCAELCCKNPDAFEAYVESFLSKFPERKSFSKLPQMLSQIDESKLDAELAGFCEKRERLPLLKKHCLNRIFEYCGYTPFISIGSINEVYPDIKIPKPRGRIKK